MALKQSSVIAIVVMMFLFLLPMYFYTQSSTKGRLPPSAMSPLSSQKSKTMEGASKTDAKKMEKVAALTKAPSAAQQPAQPLVNKSPKSESVPSAQASEPLRYDKTPTPAFFEKSNYELYIRVKFGFGWGEVTSLLLPSLQLFWPHCSVVMVFDGEEKEDQDAASNIAKLTEKFAPVKFRSSLRDQYTKAGLVGLRNKVDPKLVWHGYQREHIDMMYADEISTAKYIGIADSDALMITPIMPSTVFSKDGRPIVIGTVSRSAMGGDVNWNHGIMAVEFMLKKEYAICCMSYFPVILKREHITEFRAHVEKVHKKPFIEVYKEMFLLTKWYCHYSMMCNYVWHFHRDQYDFHYQSYVGWRAGWDTKLQYQVSDWSFLNEQNKHPIVRASTHASYTLGYGHLYKNYKPEAPARAFLESFCYAANAQCRNATDCDRWRKRCAASKVNLNAVQPLLFRFESWQSWEYDPKIHEAQVSHYNSLKSYPYWLSYGAYVLEKTQPTIWKQFMASAS